MTNHPYAKQIWDRLNVAIGNEKGTAAIMGNLQAESGLYPDRVQGDIPYSSYSQEYTARVNAGTISENDFVHNGPGGGGYGLAQWTFYTRKQALYNKWKSGGYASIGGVDLACDFLVEELQSSFPKIWAALQTCESIRTASDMVLHDFENPAEQGESVEILRASMGTEIFTTFTGSEPSEPSEPSTPGITGGRLSALLLYAIATDLY